MSSKRSKKKTEEEVGAEFYPTDRKCVYALLRDGRVDLPGGIWIEPCAGTGRIIAATNECRSDVQLVMCELDEDAFAPYLDKIVRPWPKDRIMPYGDFVHREWNYKTADVLIMNPPFSLTMQFVIAAMQRAQHVICLQRQGWFGTKDRSPWLRKHCPNVYQLPWRPSFTPDNKTDGAEYCWFHWPPGSIDGRAEGRILMLDKPNQNQLELL